MKLGIITTITNPHLRQDPWIEALECYSDLADEVVVVDGSGYLDDEDFSARRWYEEKHDSKVTWLDYEWPYEWSWDELPKHLNAGLKKAKWLGVDWVIKCDIDYLFHEGDFREIRKTLEQYKNTHDAVSFQKMSFVTHDKAYEKGPVVIALNVKRNDKLLFGKERGTHTDLCFPVVFNGEYDNKEVPVGNSVTNVFKSPIRVYNYDATFRTKAVQASEFHRFSRAYQRFFGEYKYGKTKEESFTVFIDMMKGRKNRCVYGFELSDHPKYIQPRIASLMPSHFGYDGWGLL